MNDTPPPPRRLPIAPPLEAQDGPTTVGSYFVANYPPFPRWTRSAIDAVHAALARPAAADTPLGLYVHIPFCRKRCHFCYYKVYTERSASEIGEYVAAVEREMEMHARLPFISGRRPRFVYFGGGTPSYLSTDQLTGLFAALQRALPWDGVEEVTFECEPGTISEAKLRVLFAEGVTRLSLGVENFDDDILSTNGRAHQSRQIHTAYEAARRVGLPQINIDLIAGMLGETDDNWRACVEKTISLDPDSVTIYQMELPANTTVSREMRAAGKTESPVADWSKKREWVGYAFAEMERAGYRVSSAYTMVKAAANVSFGYRDRLWSGADLLGIGVSSFSHVGGTHFQNEKEIELYLARVAAGELPIQRGYALTDDDRLIRELILQLKLGSVRPAYFQEKFGVDLRARFAEPLHALAGAGLLTDETERLRLSRDALLKVDSLLPAFYASNDFSDGNDSSHRA